MKKRTVRVNDQITAPSVRLIGADGAQVGIVTVDRALELAAQAGLDLVEVAPNSTPPVCKIMDFGKYLYEVSKKEKLTKKKQHVIHVKEIRLRPKIETHDYEFKRNHIRKFIEEGNRVKVTVMFRGREMAYQEFGTKIIERLTADLEDVAKLEREPQFENRTIIAYFVKK
ncbi:MAG: translation initiation factor IF-3 [candidate division KSB1 bacterium]|nr:translation initiation factor IF-3 [candidate division KSB1 bacterium]MDZ7378328.1 translation initiation factor IF-3 [candidate division KSB1 bacterium]MDZ7386738.1 translation initiation factor IF-3 [candidate division KSB1 bacterium]MDZ7392407.1 translation initiation factor IF-3 [candidate division KSB1 bacterium]